jgi:orotate phosphoribosyltransferase
MKFRSLLHQYPRDPIAKITPKIMQSPLSNIPYPTIDLTILRQHLLDLLCQLAYKEGDFTLSSGQKSTYYINGKQVTLHPEGAVATSRILLSMLPADTDAVAGLTLGADPIVAGVSVVSVYEGKSIPALIIRKEAKGHGTQAYIEGATLKSGAKVVVLEDVVTTGQSAMKAVERLRAAGYLVDRVLTLVDREQGGAEFYASQGLQFETIFTIRDLQARYRELGL